MVRPLLRWLLSTVVTIYLTVEVVVDEDLVPGFSAWLVGAAITALVGLLITSKPITKRLPQYRISRHRKGFVLEQVPAEIPSTRRLEEMTKEVVTELHEYLETAPADTSHWDRVQASRQASTEDEKSRIWAEFNKKDDQIREQQSRRVMNKFGGRVKYLLIEYGRRGLLPDEERSIDHQMWKLQSGYPRWLSELASTLEAMRHDL